MTDFAKLVEFDPSRLGVEGETHGTTVLALRYDQGVILLADRRATAGNYIMFENAEKVYALDESTLIAISGSFAKSVEVCRFLKHSFKYYRRSVLQDLSLDGKLHEISRTLASNAEAAMQGIGLFLPIVGAYDPHADTFGVYFFDGAGATFQNGSYACAGSGSERIRGVFEYIARRQGRWETRPFNDVLRDGMEILAIAAELDSATGGYQKVWPAAKCLSREGIRPISDEELKAVV